MGISNSCACDFKYESDESSLVQTSEKTEGSARKKRKEGLGKPQKKARKKKKPLKTAADVEKYFAESDGLTSGSEIETTGPNGVATHSVFVSLKFPAILQRITQAHFLRKAITQGTGTHLEAVADGACLTNGDTGTVQERIMELDKLIKGLEVLPYDIFLGEGQSRIKFDKGAMEGECYIIPTGEGSLVLIGTMSDIQQAKKTLRAPYKDIRLKSAIQALQSGKLLVTSKYIFTNGDFLQSFSSIPSAHRTALQGLQIAVQSLQACFEDVHSSKIPVHRTSEHMFANGDFLQGVDDQENSLLMHAATEASLKTVRLLMIQGMNADFGNSLTKETPLMAVCSASSDIDERIEIIRELITCKANVQAVDKSRNWGIGHYCVHSGSAKILEFLVDNTSVDFTIKSKEGATPLDLAKSSRVEAPRFKDKWAKMMNILAKISARRKDAYEYRFGHFDIIQKLLESDACLKHLTSKTKAIIGFNFHGDALKVVMDPEKIVHKRLKQLEKNIISKARRVKFESLDYGGGDFRMGRVLEGCYILYEGKDNELLLIGSSKEISQAEKEIKRKLHHGGSDLPKRPENANPAYCSLSLAAIEGEPDTKTKDCARREKIMEELQTTEDSYVQILQEMFTVYVNPLREKKLVPPKLDEHFGILEKIKTNHEQFLQGLTKTDNIPNYVHDKMDFVKRYYTKWINAYGEIVREMNKLKTKDQAKEIMKDKKEFMHYSIQLIQRPPRYELLLQDMYSKTQRDHWQYDDIFKAIAHVEAIVAHLNAARAESERQIELLDWDEKLNNWDGTLITAKRKFIFSTNCLIWKGEGHTDGVFVAFSDILFICTEDFTVKKSLERFDTISASPYKSKSLFCLRIERKERTDRFTPGGSQVVEVFSKEQSQVGKWQKQLMKILEKRR